MIGAHNGPFRKNRGIAQAGLDFDFRANLYQQIDTMPTFTPKGANLQIQILEMEILLQYLLHKETTVETLRVTQYF